MQPLVFTHSNSYSFFLTGYEWLPDIQRTERKKSWRRRYSTSCRPVERRAAYSKMLTTQIESGWQALNKFDKYNLVGMCCPLILWHASVYSHQYTITLLTFGIDVQSTLQLFAHEGFQDVIYLLCEWRAVDGDQTRDANGKEFLKDEK